MMGSARYIGFGDGSITSSELFICQLHLLHAAHWDKVGKIKLDANTSLACIGTARPAALSFSKHFRKAVARFLRSFTRVWPRVKITVFVQPPICCQDFWPCAREKSIWKKGTFVQMQGRCPNSQNAPAIWAALRAPCLLLTTWHQSNTLAMLHLRLTAHAAQCGLKL